MTETEKSNKSGSDKGNRSRPSKMNAPPASPARKKTGYKSPPQHTQFQKGASGNPGGRPKGAKNLKRLIYDLADEVIIISTHEGKKQVTLREAAGRKFMEMVLKGDYKYFQAFFAIEQEVDKLVLTEREEQRLQNVEFLHKQVNSILQLYVDEHKNAAKENRQKGKQDKNISTTCAEDICDDDEE